MTKGDDSFCYWHPQNRRIERLALTITVPGLYLANNELKNNYCNLI